MPLVLGDEASGVFLVNRIVPVGIDAGSGVEVGVGEPAGNFVGVLVAGGVIFGGGVSDVGRNMCSLVKSAGLLPTDASKDKPIRIRDIDNTAKFR